MMPSKIIEQQGLSSSSSSSYFSNEVRFPSETQVGFWRHDVATGHYENKQTVASSPLEKFRPLESHAERFLGQVKPYINSSQKGEIGMGTNTVGSGGSTSNFSTLWRPSACDISGRPNLSFQSTPYFVEGEKINMIDAQSENGLFSCSYSDLFARKLKLSENNALLGHSVGNIAHYDEDEPLESLKEIEAQTIGNLLPNDDDLLSGIADGFDYAIQPGGVDDPDDLDLFSSVGGMDLGDENSCVGLRSAEDPEVIYNGQVGGTTGSIVAEHPFGERPSRTLFVRNINSNVEDSELRSLFEQYGDIRALYTACKLRGFVMISYYDLRASQNAMRALQNQPLRRRKLDIHFSIPKGPPSEIDVNQGSLVVFNLDTSVSDDEIHQIFGLYGEIKEIREIPNRSHHKLIEFYDIRAAESAIRALNQRDISGKQIKLEHSLPWGSKSLNQQYLSDIEQNESDAYMWPNSSTIAFPGRVSSHTSGSTMDNESAPILGAAHAPITPFHESTFHDGNTSGSLSSTAADFLGNPVFHPRSFPEYYDGLSSGGVPCKSMPNNNIISNISPAPKRIENKRQHFNEVFGNGSCPLTGRHQYMLNNNTLCPPQPPVILWPNSPSFVNGVPLPQSHVLRTAASLSNHHVGVGSAPSPWERQHHQYGQEATSVGSGLRMNTLHPSSLEFGLPNTMGHPKTVGMHSHHQMCLMFPGRCSMIPVMSSSGSSFEGGHSERGRRGRNENNCSSHHDNKKQYELDIERIALGEDGRTTLMIKNIPNKYTSKMLLATIDERHRGTYDFIYLPIDFKNKCNVGYAFINMIDPSQITQFYQEFNGKKWEKFNSEKVATLAYARIQGKAALIAHFQNSSLMNEDKRCRPILFNTDGPNAGDQVPFPMGVNVRSRAGKSRTSRGSSSEESCSEME